jgi:hypothetical protein
MIGHEIPAYTNPADQLIKLMHAKEKPDPDDIKMQEELFNNYNQHIRASIENEVAEAEKESLQLNKKRLSQFRASSFCTQFQQLILRAFKNLLRNTTFTRVRIGQVIVIGILMIILFWNKKGYGQDNVNGKNGAFFFICTSQLMLSIQSVLLTCTLSILTNSSIRTRSIFTRTSKPNVWCIGLLFN